MQDYKLVLAVKETKANDFCIVAKVTSRTRLSSHQQQSSACRNLGLCFT